MKTLPIQLSKSYNIYIDYHLVENGLLFEYCRKLNKRIVIITDSHLANTHGRYVQQLFQKANLEIDLLVFPAGEVNKTRDTKQTLEDQLLQKNYGRDTCLIALGGGVVTDLAGFLGATYCRGLPVIYLPTTLLAMVDASIGGKTGVNTPYGKNLIGTFTQPHAVFIDTYFLSTLPEKEWYNGAAEMIKHAIIADAQLFEILLANANQIKHCDSEFLIDMIYASCLIKKNIVEQDEQEQGLRQLLNFGHTIGHAVETIEQFDISHGEAVAIGMLVETYLSHLYGYAHENLLPQLEKILQGYGLPLKTSAFHQKQSLQKALMLDKKSIKNMPHCVLLAEIGKPYCNNNRFSMPIDSIYLCKALDWAAEFFK